MKIFKSVSQRATRMAQAPIVMMSSLAVATLFATGTAHAGTPVREVMARPWDFFNAVYSVFSSWDVGSAFRGLNVSPWAIAYQCLIYAWWWNPIATCVILALAAVGLGLAFYYFVWPRIVSALRARGFST